MKKGINKYFGTLIMGTALMAVPSCTDTWNEHYQPEDQNTAKETLWELLENREDLSKFRTIISKAKFYRDEKHPAYTLNGTDTIFYTYKDVLNGTMPVTVWAVNNDAMTDEEWAKLENMAEKEGYNLQQQFLGNHIALYRKPMQHGKEDKFRLINNKIVITSEKDGILFFENSEADETNIPANNGLLHVIRNKNDFFYNLYEYIKFSDEVIKFKDYLIKRDTIYFNESGSIEGLPDENGNPTYVDSVFYQDNMVFNYYKYDPTSMDAADAWMSPQKMFKAQINTEDSCFVMIIPSDATWENTIEKLTPLYTYVNTYPRMTKVKDPNTTKASLSTKNARAGFHTGLEYGSVDSLQSVNIDCDIISPIVFNVNEQPNVNGKKQTLEDFVNGGYEKCDYLLNTIGDTIRAVDGWDFKELFNGKKIKMSNGYAFITDKWNFHRSFWHRNIEAEANNKIYQVINANNTTAEGKSIYNSVVSEWAKKYGYCSKQDYLYVYRSGTSQPEITFALNGNQQGEASVMSGKYDVQVVLVPLWFNEYKDSTTVDEDALTEKIKKNKIVCTLYYWDESCIKATDYRYTRQKKQTFPTFEYKGEKVDTITVFEDFEFPVSYQNIYDSYPILSIKSAPSTTEVNNGGFSRSFCIDRIILKSKETD